MILILEKRKLSPPQILALGFLSVILIGAILLSLPVSNTKGCSFIDAVFTSTSAVCVTGLIVLDTPNDFTLFGHLVILVLIQIGGLGYMTSATLFFLIAGKKIGITQRYVIKEGLNVGSVEGIIQFAKGVVLFTIIFEFAGTVILTGLFLREYSFGKAFLYGLFHAISAFNNAGFSLFSDSLMRYRGDIVINMTITTLIIVGGIGFVVITDIHKFIKREVDRLAAHTKLVLLSTGVLISGAAVSIFLIEYANPDTFAAMSLKEKILASYFSAVTARTAGFNTVDYSLFKTETLFLTITLMFIGASPGGTGGGVKTSTVAIVFASILSTIRGRADTVFFKRRMSAETVINALSIIILAVIFCTVFNHLILLTQDTKYLHSVFEVTSAFGTVGLSLGDQGVRSFTALFNPTGKIIIILLMFVGRLGPLTLAFALTRQVKERFRYPEGKVMIG